MSNMNERLVKWVVHFHNPISECESTVELSDNLITDLRMSNLNFRSVCEDLEELWGSGGDVEEFKNYCNTVQDILYFVQERL